MFMCDGESITLAPQLPVELPAHHAITNEPEITIMNAKNLILGILLGSALAAGIFVATRVTAPVEPQYAFIVPIPGALPEFSLLDQTGEPVNAGTFRGQWDLVFFGFTNCPDICPTTLQTLATARADLVAAKAETLPRIVLVSVDPERDTPELLGQYVDYFGDDNLAVTGELAEVRKLADGLGIYFEKAPTEDGNYGVDHSAAVLIIDPNGEFSGLFSAPHVVANYLHDLPIIMGKQ
jgi:protein SCO1